MIGTSSSLPCCSHIAPVAMLQPFELMYGRDAHLPEDVLFSIPATAEDPIQYADVLKNRLQLAYKRVNQHMAVQQGH